MKLETKKNQKKFHLLIDPGEILVTKEEWRVTVCSPDV